jgi:hypothetical protein
MSNQIDTLVVEVATTSTFSSYVTLNSVENWRHTNELMAIGTFGFRVSIEELQPVLSIGNYIRMSVSKPGASPQIRYVGILTHVGDQLSADGGAVTVRGVGRGRDLMRDEVQEVEIYEWEVVDALRVHAHSPQAGTLVLEDVNSGLAYDSGDPDTYDELKLYFWETAPSNGRYWLYWITDAPHRAIRPILGSAALNSVAATLFPQPFDGTGWWNAEGIVDGTAISGVPFAQTGWITWDRNNQETPITHEEVYGYWGRIYSNTNLDTVHLVGLEVEQAAEHSSIIDEIANYLPAGWSMSASSPSAPVYPQMFAGYGVNVFEMFYQLAQQSNEVFRINNVDGEVDWMANAASNGIRAVDYKESFETEETTARIIEMRRKQIDTRLVTRINPRGAGDDLIVCPNISALTVSDANAIALATGFTILPEENLIVNTPLEGSLGGGVEITESVQFPHIHALLGGVGNNRQTSRQVAYAAISWLENHTTSNYWQYDATVINVDPDLFHEGALCNVRYDIPGVNGATVESIDENLIITSITYQPTPDGHEIYTISFSRTLWPLPTPDRQAAEAALTAKRLANHPRGVFKGRVIDNMDQGPQGVDPGISAQFPWWNHNVTDNLYQHIIQTDEAHEIPTQIDDKIIEHLADTESTHYADQFRAVDGFYFESYGSGIRVVPDGANAGIRTNIPLSPEGNNVNYVGEVNHVWGQGYFQLFNIQSTFNLQNVNVTERILNCDTVVRTGGPLPEHNEAAGFPVGYTWISTTLYTKYRHRGGGVWESF